MGSSIMPFNFIVLHFGMLVASHLATIGDFYLYREKGVRQLPINAIRIILIINEG